MTGVSPDATNAGGWQHRGLASSYERNPAVVRQGLRLLIDGESGLQLVAEAETVPDAERLTYAHRPNVLVLDLNMPGGSSLDAIPRLLAQAPATAIVVLTMQDDPAFARQALRAGALGYVLKEAADDELLTAIHLAAAGGTYLNPVLAARLAAGHFPVIH